MSGECILIVDDEINIIQLVRLYLQREGYRVESARDGKTALRMVDLHSPALMILDIMLPELDGLEVCRRLRAANNDLAIIMLSARDEDIDKILGLELGADDYLTKPFNPRELVARVKAILRRNGRIQSEELDKVMSIADLIIDEENREVSINGTFISLRTQEFEVLAALARNLGRVMTRDQLLQQAWGYDFAGETRTVDVHIAQLRRKLAKSSVKIETITGIGYKLVA
jgi:DNA-binding response OmpR family regulator